MSPRWQALIAFPFVGAAIVFIATSGVWLIQEADKSSYGDYVSGPDVSGFWEIAMVVGGIALIGTGIISLIIAVVALWIVVVEDKW